MSYSIRCPKCGCKELIRIGDKNSIPVSTWRCTNDNVAFEHHDYGDDRIIDDPEKNAGTPVLLK